MGLGRHARDEQQLPVVGADGVRGARAATDPRFRCEELFRARQLSDGGAASWRTLAPYTYDVDELGFGDFDGDGRTDVFRTDGSRWYFSSGAREQWAPLASSSCGFGSLAVADFTGDGRADVFGGRC